MYARISTRGPERARFVRTAAERAQSYRHGAERAFVCRLGREYFIAERHGLLDFLHANESKRFQSLYTT